MMRRLLTLLRAGALILLAAGLVVGLGRAVVNLRESDHAPGLSGAVQVFEWADPVADSGGYSGLIVSPDGSRLIASSDRGHFLSAGLIRDAQGQITGLDTPVLIPVLSHRDGKPTIPFHSDLEGLAPLPDGRIALAFESYTRLQILPAGEITTPMQPQITHGWDRFEPLFGNQAFEAITALPASDLGPDQILAIVEGGKSRGQTEAYLYDGTAWTGPQPFAQTRGFVTSGADLGPDGCLYILERRYGVFTGFQFQLTRRSPGDLSDPGTVLYRSKPMQLGNGEGLSVWQKDGRLSATVITDNGFPPLQPTRIIELPLVPAPGCADQ